MSDYDYFVADEVTASAFRTEYRRKKVVGRAMTLLEIRLWAAIDRTAKTGGCAVIHGRQGTIFTVLAGKLFADFI